MILPTLVLIGFSFVLYKILKNFKKKTRYYSAQHKEVEEKYTLAAAEKIFNENGCNETGFIYSAAIASMKLANDLNKEIIEACVLNNSELPKLTKISEENFDFEKMYNDSFIDLFSWCISFLSTEDGILNTPISYQKTIKKNLNTLSAGLVNKVLNTNVSQNSTELKILLYSKQKHRMSSLVENLTKHFVKSCKTENFGEDLQFSLFLETILNLFEKHQLSAFKKGCLSLFNSINNKTK